jgi:hypothetical protein
MLTPLQFTPALCGKKLLQLSIRNLTRNHPVRQSRLSRVILAQRLSRNRRMATLSTTAFQTPNPGHALTPIDLRRREPFPNMLRLTPPTAGDLDIAHFICATIRIWSFARSSVALDIGSFTRIAMAAIRFRRFARHPRPTMLYNFAGRRSRIALKTAIIDITKIGIRLLSRYRSGKHSHARSHSTGRLTRCACRTRDFRTRCHATQTLRAAQRRLATCLINRFARLNTYNNVFCTSARCRSDGRGRFRGRSCSNSRHGPSRGCFCTATEATTTTATPQRRLSSSHRQTPRRASIQKSILPRHEP